MPTVMNGVSLNALTTVDTWSALSLFANGEQGAWYDPSDMSTMFQDAAGTIPVTAVEQPVGLILDKSKNLKSVFVGGLPFVSPWFGYNGGTIAGNTVTNSAGGQGAGIQTFAGRTYRITANVASISGTFYYVAEGVGTNYGTVVSGQQSFLFRATSGNLVIYGISAGSVTYNSLRIEEIPGNHASQATDASRPVLSARVNLLTYSEQFDNDAVWNKLNSGTGVLPVVTANYAVAPNGSQTADRIQFDLGATPTTALSRLFQGGLPVITSCVNSIYLKTNDGTTKTLYFGRSDGNTFDSITVTSEWQQFVAPASGSNNGQMQFGLSGASSGVPVTTSTIADILAWGADLRVTNDGVGIPAYQRVGAAVTGTSGTISPPVAAVTGVPDYDTNGFPLYLRFDGVDDSLATASIDFSATDKMSVFAGVRKLSDAAVGVIAELSVNGGLNNGVFILTAPNDVSTANYGWYSKGTVLAQVLASPYASLITQVMTGIGDIVSDAAVLRLNGAQVGTSVTDQGTGNYGNYPLYIGRRGGSSFPFSGRLYSLIVRGALSNSTQIENAENYINSKTKAY